MSIRMDNDAWLVDHQMHASNPLNVEEIRFDGWGRLDNGIIEVDASAESTRYHVLLVPVTTLANHDFGTVEWLVVIENMAECTPLLGQLGDWHYTYFQAYVKNSRTAMALAHIVSFATDVTKGLMF